MSQPLEITPSQSPIVLDAMGKPCPMPLLILKKQLKKTEPGQQILLMSSDPHSQLDIGRFCQLNQLKHHIDIISEYEFHYIVQI